MIDNIIDTERIGLDYDSNDNEYTLTSYDIYGHYDSEIKLSNEQLYDVLTAIEKIRSRLEKSQDF